MVRQRTASAPSSAACWKAAWNAPGEGAAVWGRSPLPRQRSQNSVGVSWRRSSSSWSPKRMDSGTTMTLCSLTSWSVRSQALSVTMWTPGMHESATEGGRRPGRALGEPGQRVGGPWRRRVGLGLARRCDASDGARRPGRDRADGTEGPAGSDRPRWRSAVGVVAPPQPDHDRPEGQPAGDDGTDDTCQQPTDAGRGGEVRHQEHDDAHRHGGDDDADEGGPRLALGQAAEPLTED